MARPADALLARDTRLGVDIGTAAGTDPLAAAARLRQLLGGARALRVLVLSSDTGGGHRASAHALRAALEARHGPLVRVTVADFFVDLAQGGFASAPQRYAFLAKHPWMWKIAYEITRFPPVRGISEWSMNLLAHNNIRAAFEHHAPDLIVSVHPLVNTLSMHVLRVLRARNALPSPPFVTVVTDLGGAHPTWFNPRADMVYVPSNGVAAVARACRVRPDRLRQYGLPVRKDFWKPPTLPQASLRKLLGMPEPPPVAILLIGGGDGVGNLGAVARAIDMEIARARGHDAAQLVVICGRNEKLAADLSAYKWNLPVKVHGYVNNISDWMAACDILCTKAGPGTIAEGLIRGMPILLSGFLPGQEEANVKYIVDNGAGEYSCKPRKLGSIAARWVADPDALNRMRTCALGLARPQATLEIADDIWEVTRSKLMDNVATLDHRHRIQQAQAALVRSHMRDASNRISASGALVSNSRESHLMTRLRVLMQIVCGSVIARDALTYPQIANF